LQLFKHVLPAELKRTTFSPNIVSLISTRNFEKRMLVVADLFRTFSSFLMPTVFCSLSKNLLDSERDRTGLLPARTAPVNLNAIANMG
jgi:hypothetical protein